MRLVIQRIKEAFVKVDDKIVGQIKQGALVLFGCHKNDTESSVKYLADKLIHLRMFSDENYKMNLSLLDIQGEVLVISQFTLYASTQGRRPSFTDALDPLLAENFYQKFIADLKKNIKKVDTGIFGAKMEVSLINDGPVTLIIDSK
jgi:D-aminoacyl-tRNA deacylase